MSVRLRTFLAPLAFVLGALAASAADAGQVIYPAGTPAAAGPAARAPDTGLGAVTIVGVIVFAGAGGWLMWRGRKLPFQGRDLRKLAIDETRSLGSRQYLVVTSYEGKKFLLGVCPGRIELLTRLDSSAATEKIS